MQYFKIEFEETENVKCELSGNPPTIAEALFNVMEHDKVIKAVIFCAAQLYNAENEEG